jgi:hypothetical protein
VDLQEVKMNMAQGLKSFKPQPEKDGLKNDQWGG